MARENAGIFAEEVFDFLVIFFIDEETGRHLPSLLILLIALVPLRALSFRMLFHRLSHATELSILQIIASARYGSVTNVTAHLSKGDDRYG